MNGKVRFLPCQTDLKMRNSVKREITGDTGLIPECDFPVGSEHTDTVERNRFGVTHNSQDRYSFSVVSLCVFTVYVNV